MNRLHTSNLKPQSWAAERKILLALFGMEDLPELLIEIAVVRACVCVCVCVWRWRECAGRNGNWFG